MFPTSGYFKSIPCPYFNTSVCERPNCHFKHQKASTSDHRHKIPSYASSGSRLQSYSTRGHGSSSSHSGSSEYKPTAKPKRSSYRSAALPRPHYQHDPFPTGPSTLVYKPTPISELNKLHSDPEKKDEAQKSTTSDAVINAEFQVIGQKNALTTSNDIPNGQGDGPLSDKVEDIDIDNNEDDSLFKGVNDAQQVTQGETVLPESSKTQDTEQSIVAADEESPAVEPPRPKRILSKQELEEFVDLFGEASDDELDNAAEENSKGKDRESEEDVREIPPTVKPKGPLIDLTVETSSEDDEKTANRKQEKSNSDNMLEKKTSDKNGEKHKLKQEKHDGSKSKKSSKHKSKHKSSKNSSKPGDKCKRRDSSHSERVDTTPEKSAKQQKTAPVIVSSSVPEDQCKELFAMFDRDEAMECDNHADDAVPDVIILEVDTSKKRTARSVAEALSRNSVKKKMSILSPQELMHKRYEDMKEAALNKEKDDVKIKNGNSNLPSSQKVDYNATPGATSARTYKGLERKAHQPLSKKVKRSLERPRIPPGSKGKVAVGVRQMKLDVVIDECLKLYPDESDAFARAKSEEEAAFSRANSRVIYTNLIANIVKKIRDELGANRSGPSQSMVSHESVLAGKSASKFTVGLKRKSSVSLTKEDMVGELLFKKLRTYLLSESQLVDHGYPRSDPGKPGHALIQWSHYDKIPNNKGNMRTCRRCGKTFWVTDDGGYRNKEECIYHWGKSFQTRVHGTVDMHFSCCQGKPGAEGCTICYGHVHDTNKYEDLTGYMKTFAKNEKDYCGVYSLDCEMVYTTRGLEIARVTVIDDKLNVMLDSIIKPPSEIIDYNTRFSGLTADNFKNVDTSLKDVQAILLNIFQEDTVLIGHSLNSDLIALKLIHSNLVDTSLVWPHKHGLPYKRALKTLMLEILNKRIQEAGSSGHDSSEDASACMELMKWKVFQGYMKDNR